MKFAESLRSCCASQKVPMAEVRFCVLDPPRTPRTDFLVALIFVAFATVDGA